MNSSNATARIHWGRIIAGAIMGEAILIGLAIPMGVYLSERAFVLTVQPAVFAVGFISAYWVARKVKGRHALHGALVAIVATLIYMALIANQFSRVVALYGPVLLILGNVLRLLGCVFGALAAKRSQEF